MNKKFYPIKDDLVFKKDDKVRVGRVLRINDTAKLAEVQWLDTGYASLIRVEQLERVKTHGKRRPKSGYERIGKGTGAGTDNPSGSTKVCPTQGEGAKPTSATNSGDQKA